MCHPKFGDFMAKRSRSRFKRSRRLHTLFYKSELWYRGRLYYTTDFRDKRRFAVGSRITDTSHGRKRRYYDGDPMELYRVRYDNPYFYVKGIKHWYYETTIKGRSADDCYLGPSMSRIAQAYFLKDTQLTALGTKAWSRFAPAKSKLDLMQSLAELSDIKKLYQQIKQLPLSVKSVSAGINKSSDTYLGYQFGVKPIINDLEGLVRRQDFAEKRLAHLIRMRGKTQLRKGLLELKTSNVSVRSGKILGAHFPGLVSGAYSARDDRTEEIVYSRRVWFAGRFGFYVPKVVTHAWKSKQHRRMQYGINPSAPALVNLAFQLSRMSWMTGWYSSLPEIFRNLAATNDGVYAKYAYIMVEEKLTLYHTTTIHFNGKPVTVRGKTTYTRKKRVEATPFGFGISIPDFTAWQQSIVAALLLKK
jgi:hypothetical protein